MGTLTHLDTTLRAEKSYFVFSQTVVSMETEVKWEIRHLPKGQQHRAREERSWVGGTGNGHPTLLNHAESPYEVVRL